MWIEVFWTCDSNFFLKMFEFMAISSTYMSVIFIVNFSGIGHVHINTKRAPVDMDLYDLAFTEPVVFYYFFFFSYTH